VQTVNQLVENLSLQEPFLRLTRDQQNDIFSSSQIVKFESGQYILRPNELSQSVYVVISGVVRFLVTDNKDGQLITLQKRGPGELLGWSSLLVADAYECVSASGLVLALSLPAKEFVKAIKHSPDFSHYFSTLPGPTEAYRVLSYSVNNNSKLVSTWRDELMELIKEVQVRSFRGTEGFLSEQHESIPMEWFLSTSGIPGWPVGSHLSPGVNLPVQHNLSVPYRAVGVIKSNTKKSLTEVRKTSQNKLQQHDDLPQATSFHQLGILEQDNMSDSDKYPIVHGRGPREEAIAVIQMVSLQQNVPFRRDTILKAVTEYYRRDKSPSLELLASLFELVGLTCQLAETDNKNLLGIEAPALFMVDSIPVVLFGCQGSEVVLAHPHSGLQRISIDEFRTTLPERVRFILPRRGSETLTKRFGWSWFTPLLSKYKVSLAMVLGASLLAQLFGLAIPLLIQQIIDKVLTQGSLNSLNVLGTAMVVLALFQGLLTVLRGYIFVDTTDRMDLTLGSAVIDRLLALPLTYFEKRTVGDLSQRIGELNTIRAFTTGTALTSLLNIVFATLYLIVMIIYSPLLTGVALSTFPIYLIMTFVLAPIYKNLIRKRAIAQAHTQSHLIEILGGIQTVKAQHFELTARWKWQDRYRDYVDQGFKSVALGSAAGEVGNFLNQFSGLLVLWIGMWMILNGNLTLGQLIAFRIISGNVTGPLLQLAGIYQGFQGVQLSMERLSDVLDHRSEFGNDEDLGQISLPPIIGNIRFDMVSFRFLKTGIRQVDEVDIEIPAGSFVGIVGQSGSGKSTLMKLLPRLYDVESGRIFIDDYDISKVNLTSLRRQIGIVPQDSLLFEGTIAENISLNDPQASNEAIISAAKIACAHEFIMSMELGYATPLAERGANLSGGQKQRLAIARTILSNPQLLVMDEATSALDYNTERQLCKNLQSWSAGRTVLFITHRLSTIVSSDLILLMEKGRLVEHGTHSQLLNQNQRYAALYMQQSNIP